MTTLFTSPRDISYVSAAASCALVRCEKLIGCLLAWILYQTSLLFLCINMENIEIVFITKL